MTTYSLIDESGETRLRGTIVPAPGGGSQTVKRAYLRLTSAWILAHSTDYATQVLVAGNATTAIVPVGAVAALRFATTAYAGAGSADTDIAIGFGDPVVNPVDALGQPTAVWEATDDAIVHIGATSVPMSSQVPSVRPLGEDLRVYLLGLGLTDGDSPVDLWVWYIEHDLTDLT